MLQYRYRSSKLQPPSILLDRCFVFRTRCVVMRYLRPFSRSRDLAGLKPRAFVAVHHGLIAQQLLRRLKHRNRADGQLLLAWVH